MPFMTLIYLGQCYLFSNLFPTMQVGTYCLLLGLSLVSMIGLMFHYNTQHNVNIYQSHISVDFKLLFINKVLKISEIESIHLSDPEMSFSNIVIVMNDNSKHNLYFVDDAKKVVDLISNQKKDFNPIKQAA